MGRGRKREKYIMNCLIFVIKIVINVSPCVQFTQLVLYLKKRT